MIFTDKTRYYNENFTRKTFHQICQKDKAKYREMGLRVAKANFIPKLDIKFCRLASSFLKI